MWSGSLARTFEQDTSHHAESRGHLEELPETGIDVQVLSATWVVSFVTELLVAKLIAGSEQHVMHTTSAVLDECQHRPSKSADQGLSLARLDAAIQYPRVHR